MASYDPSGGGQYPQQYQQQYPQQYQQQPPPNTYNAGPGYGDPNNNSNNYNNNNNNYGNNYGNVPPQASGYAQTGGYNNLGDGPKPPPNNMQYDGGGQPSFDQAFQVQHPKWNDLWAGILFLATFFGFVAISGIAIADYVRTPGHAGGSKAQTPTFGLTTETIFLFVYVLALAFVLSQGYLLLARMFTKQFIWITGILNIGFGVATCAYMLYKKQYVGGIIFGVFVVFQIICFISWIPRIPFSALMLQTSIDVAKHHGHVCKCQ